MSELDIGDAVKLAGRVESPRMIIVEQSGSSIQCLWFDKDNHAQYAWIHEKALIPAVKPKDEHIDIPPFTAGK